VEARYFQIMPVREITGENRTSFFDPLAADCAVCFPGCPADGAKRQRTLLTIFVGKSTWYGSIRPKSHNQSEENYREKVNTLKESYFPKASVKSDDNTTAGTETEELDVSDHMAAYLTAITRGQKHGVGAGQEQPA